jgi:hypothetical protein
LPSTYAPCPRRGHPSVEDKDALDDEDAVGDEEAVEDDDADSWALRTAAITATTTTRPATRMLRIRIRRAAVRAGLLEVTPPFKAAWCCQHVCGFRYAHDMERL